MTAFGLVVENVHNVLGQPFTPRILCILGYLKRRHRFLSHRTAEQLLQVGVGMAPASRLNWRQGYFIWNK